MPEIRVAIAGVGNCASSLVQGIIYYSRKSEDAIGLMHSDICGYKPGDIRFVAAFDIDRRKVGVPLEKAIFAPPNCPRQRGLGSRPRVSPFSWVMSSTAWRLT